jgi:propionyl-CoA synthetase
MARDDDVINVAGHRLSTSAIEEVLLTHPGVGDAAVVGVADKLKGQLPLGLVVPRAGFTGDLAQELVAKVRNDLGAVAAFRLITLVQGLPRTRSGIIYFCLRSSKFSPIKLTLIMLSIPRFSGFR